MSKIAYKLNVFFNSIVVVKKIDFSQGPSNPKKIPYTTPSNHDHNKAMKPT